MQYERDAEVLQRVHQRLGGDGTLLASKNKEWMRFKWDGSPLQPPNGRFVEGLCRRPPFPLKVGDKIGLVAADGTLVTPVHFDAIARVGAEAWDVRIGSRWGRIATSDGRWLISPRFDYLSADEGLPVAAVDGKRGFLSFDGSWLIEPRFDAAARLIERPFIVRLLGRPAPDSAFVTIPGATGLLRLKDQSLTIPPRPGVMCHIPNTDAIIWQSDSNLVIMSLAGETWYDIDPDRIGTLRDPGLVSFRRSKWGLVDTAGQVMVEAHWLSNGQAAASVDHTDRVVCTLAALGKDSAHTTRNAAGEMSRRNARGFPDNSR